MLTRPADLPDPFIGLPPTGFKELKPMSLQGPGRLVGLYADPAGEVQRIHELTIHIQLMLIDRRIADSHGSRSFVSWEPIDL